jgi:hypothetical protein
MSTRSQQSFIKPVVLAVSEGATTPNPGIVNTLVLSSTSGMYMRWTGSVWTGVTASLATTTKWGVD